MRYVLIFLAFASAAMAVEPAEMLPDPALEARAQAIDLRIRCMQCVSEVIASSNASWAADARGVVRELIMDGQSDDQIYTFFVEKYGDKVVMQPRFRPFNYVLWFAGPLLLLGGGFSAMRFVRRRSKSEPEVGLSQSEQEKLDKLLGK